MGGCWALRGHGRCTRPSWICCAGESNLRWRGTKERRWFARNAGRSVRGTIMRRSGSEHDLVDAGDFAEEDDQDGERDYSEGKFQPEIPGDFPEPIRCGGGNREEVHEARPCDGPATNRWERPRRANLTFFRKMSWRGWKRQKIRSSTDGKRPSRRRSSAAKTRTMAASGGTGIRSGTEEDGAADGATGAGQTRACFKTMR